MALYDFDYPGESTPLRGYVACGDSKHGFTNPESDHAGMPILTQPRIGAAMRRAP